MRTAGLCICRPPGARMGWHHGSLRANESPVRRPYQTAFCSRSLTSERVCIQGLFAVLETSIDSPLGSTSAGSNRHPNTRVAGLAPSPPPNQPEKTRTNAACATAPASDGVGRAATVRHSQATLGSYLSTSRHQAHCCSLVCDTSPEHTPGQPARRCHSITCPFSRSQTL